MTPQTNAAWILHRLGEDVLQFDPAWTHHQSSASFDINYRLKPGWHQNVLEFTDSSGADLVIQTNGDNKRSHSVNAARDVEVLT